MPENRPYTFELASFLLEAKRNNTDTANIHETAQRNGVDTGQLQRAADILEHFTTNDQDTAEWIHREYLIDGWLHGYIPPDQTDIPTYIAAQLAEAHYTNPTN